jgi:hypothetical protein
MEFILMLNADSETQFSASREDQISHSTFKLKQVMSLTTRAIVKLRMANFGSTIVTLSKSLFSKIVGKEMMEMGMSVQSGIEFCSRNAMILEQSVLNLSQSWF